MKVIGGPPRPPCVGKCADSGPRPVAFRGSLFHGRAGGRQAKGAWFWTPSSNDAAFFFIGLVLILGAAGRTWGLDGTLEGRMPSWLG